MPSRIARRVVVHVDEADERLQLEVGVARAGRVAHPLDLLVGLGGCERRGRVGRVPVAGTQVGVDADDLRFLRGQREHLLAAPADEEGHRLLHRFRHPVELGDRVVLAREGEGTVVRETGPS